ncbi:hypothetical protein NDI76_01970 [Halogeometricum sp. S1BR25-6]|uniref:HTH bat-type domain-containing protein n=1 Tax=Halogeometricum salsisoli TaxID=2950536 RepID=A0ABU2GB63_9EURY|nr:hypothetical protein [Halogeometricum sp. S1BR25-6]MDS0297508.1 hypothetical protein [Halogeometricum sp. S1BR25-6]
MHTEAELNDEFEPVDADECTEMRLAAEVGYTVEALATHFEFDEATVRHHLDGHCSHY